MHYFLNTFTHSFFRQTFLLIGLALIFCLSGCGSDETPGSQSVTSKPQHLKQQPNQLPVKATELVEAQRLHNVGIETFAIGLGAEDVTAVVQGITMLEEATLKAPDNNAYWVDLADAYISSELAVYYPGAVNIYWMLYQEEEGQRDAMLSRLVNAYQKVGNRQAAFDAAALQLQRASEQQVNQAALQITWLAFANGQSHEAAKQLTDKAKDLGRQDFLLLLAASLKELVEDRDGAIKLVDQALAKMGNDTESARLAKQMRGRLTP